MDIHSPRWPLHAGISLIIRRNPMRVHVARAAEKETGRSGTRQGGVMNWRGGCKIIHVRWHAHGDLLPTCLYFQVVPNSPIYYSNELLDISEWGGIQQETQNRSVKVVVPVDSQNYPPTRQAFSVTYDAQQCCPHGCLTMRCSSTQVPKSCDGSGRSASMQEMEHAGHNSTLELLLSSTCASCSWQR